MLSKISKYFSALAMLVFALGHHCAAFEEGEAPMDKAPRIPKYKAKGYSRIFSEPTGFFRVEEIDGKWWAIDPNGNGFYMIGTDHCNYQVHWCEKLGYSPHNKFVKEKYGSEEKWAASAVKRLKEWNFNSLGANNSPSTRHSGLAHAIYLGIGSGFASEEDICPQTTWTGFPNVFHPRFREYCRKQAGELCAPMKDDRWLLGYFIDNELEWYGKSGELWGLCDEVFKKPADHSAKIALVAENTTGVGTDMDSL